MNHQNSIQAWLSLSLPNKAQRRLLMIFCGQRLFLSNLVVSSLCAPDALHQLEKDFPREWAGERAEAL